MRLIDADAFAEFLKDAVKQQKYENTKIDRLLTVADVIEAVISELEGTSLVGFKNAPTIEPEQRKRKGKWIHDNPNTFKCSRCNKYLDISCGNMKMNFCPNCGADMRGDSDV